MHKMAIYIKIEPGAEMQKLAYSIIIITGMPRTGA